MGSSGFRLTCRMKASVLAAPPEAAARHQNQLLGQSSGHALIARGEDGPGAPHPLSTLYNT